MRISVIFTGGTIGSLTGSEWVGLNSKTNYMLLEKFAERYSGITFNTSEPYSILSENLTASQLNLLQSAVEKELSNKPDGIIITHGTDTLQYAGAAIEFAFGGAEIPIIFVSADYPLDNPKTNGFINFEAAVEMIKSGKEKGVFVSYKNESESLVKLHLASRIFAFNESCAEIGGINSVAAVYENGEISFKDAHRNENPNQTGVTEYSENSGLLLVECRPGDSFAYSLDGVRAVLLKPYHSGTLNTDSENLTAFCKRAEEKGIPVFVSGVKGGIGYESSKAFEDLGLIPAPYSTFISLYVKLWAAVSRGEALEEAANNAIANEIAE